MVGDLVVGARLGIPVGLVGDIVGRVGLEVALVGARVGVDVESLLEKATWYHSADPELDCDACDAAWMTVGAAGGEEVAVE